MLYIKRLLGLLFFSAHCSLVIAGVEFDASWSSQVPESALIGTHGAGAAVEVVDKKLKITPGSGINSARAAMALPTKGGTASDASREIKLDFEPFTGRHEEGRAGVWAGFVTAQAGAQTIYGVAGNWLGIVLELKEGAEEGMYSVTLRQRWAMDDSGGPFLTSGVSSDVAINSICTLTACPTQIEMRVEDGVIRITFVGAKIAAVGAPAERSGGERGVDVLLQPEMAEILKGDLDPVFGLANYGELQETPVWLINSFSVSP